MKSIMVEQLVREFSLEVLAGENELNRSITRLRTHRPGLEFIGYFDFFQWNVFKSSARRRLHIYTS